jgi:hypothetical protein
MVVYAAHDHFIKAKQGLIECIPVACYKMVSEQKLDGEGLWKLGHLPKSTPGFVGLTHNLLKSVIELCSGEPFFKWNMDGSRAGAKTVRLL